MFIRIKTPVQLDEYHPVIRDVKGGLVLATLTLAGCGPDKQRQILSEIVQAVNCHERALDALRDYREMPGIYDEIRDDLSILIADMEAPNE